MNYFTRTFDLLIEQFQDRDWIGIPHETFVIVVWFYILVIHFTRLKGISLSGSLVLYMCEVSVGSVLQILLVLTQSHYVV